MPEIHIRPAKAADLLPLSALDHSYASDHVWQLDPAVEDGLIQVGLRRVQLPRAIPVAYPRPLGQLTEDWLERSGMLTALLDDQLVGYAGMQFGFPPEDIWLMDLVVASPLRRQGIGSALMVAALEWSRQHNGRYLMLALQHKNHPGIELARKFGFEFCGYNDRYYANHDIALFFARSAR